MAASSGVVVSRGGEVDYETARRARPTSFGHWFLGRMGIMEDVRSGEGAVRAGRYLLRMFLRSVIEEEKGYWGASLYWTTTRRQRQNLRWKVGRYGMENSGQGVVGWLA